MQSGPLLEGNNSQEAVILFVDDEEAICKLMKMYLESQHFDVITAANGLDALHIFENNGRIQVVVTDEDMPLITGQNLIREVLRIKPTVGVIFASSNMPDERSTAARQIRILKPYLPGELESAVRTLLAA